MELTEGYKLANVRSQILQEVRLHSVYFEQPSYTTFSKL